MVGSRKGLAFLDAIATAENRMKAAPREPEVAHPPTPGFVGKVLSDSNASLDSRLAEAEREAAEQSALVTSLKEKLEGGAVAVKIDSSRVRPSAFADRHPCAFVGAEFEQFVEEIKATGGNREPAIVRPLTDDPNFDYELATGHRRHRASLVANLPLFAFVRDLSDEELLVSMATENRGRKDLSAFERGRHYANLLLKGKYPSARALAASLNESTSVIHRLLTYGELPNEIIAGFSDPRTIRQPWISPLKTAYERDSSAFLVEVESIRAEGNLSASDIYKRLAGLSQKRSIVASEEKILASVRMIHDRPAIVLYKGAPQELMDQLKALIEQYHGEHQVEHP